MEWLASRTQWATVAGIALLGITLPLAIWSGWLYLRACRVHGTRAQAHGLTLAAIGLAICALSAGGWFWWVMLT